ncbi:MAG: hypothetical protein ABSD89_12835 [Halobacteriota archaeon]
MSHILSDPISFVFGFLVGMVAIVVVIVAVWKWLRNYFEHYD